jgi:tetratricopeptide (TPR) repeat protein
VFARPLDVERRTKGVGSKLAVSLAMSVLGLLLLLSFAIRIDSNDAQVHSIRAAYLVTQGNLDRAIIESDQAIRLNPNDALPHIFRAVYLVKQGNLDRAIIELDQAIRLNSNNARAYWLRGLAKEQNGDIEGAIADLALAIQDNPARDDGGHGESSLLPPSKSAEAHNHVAWLLATAAQPGIRDGRRALESALKACELTQWKNAAFIDTLAAAYARSGDFAKAAEWQQKAATDPRLGRDDSALQRLRLYQAGKAYPPD